MESESVLIVATVIIYINIGIIIHSELNRSPTYDSIFNTRDVLSRVICPASMAVNVIAMIGAYKNKSYLLVPLMILLVLSTILITLSAGYYLVQCILDDGKNTGESVCALAVVFVAASLGAIMFISCFYFIVSSVYKSLKYGPIEDEDGTELKNLRKDTAEYDDDMEIPSSSQS